MHKWKEFVGSYRRDCPDSAKAVLHELHINDRIEGTANSKLFPVLKDGTMKWAVLVDHLAGKNYPKKNKKKRKVVLDWVLQPIDPARAEFDAATERVIVRANVQEHDGATSHYQVAEFLATTIDGVEIVNAERAAIAFISRTRRWPNAQNRF